MNKTNQLRKRLYEMKIQPFQRHYQSIKTQIFTKQDLSTSSSQCSNTVFPIVTLFQSTENTIYSLNGQGEKITTEQNHLKTMPFRSRRQLRQLNLTSTRGSKGRSFCQESHSSNREILNQMMRCYSVSRKNYCIRKPQILSKKKTIEEKVEDMPQITSSSVIVVAIKKHTHFNLKAKENIHSAKISKYVRPTLQLKQNVANCLTVKNTQQQLSPIRKLSISPWNIIDDDQE